MLPFWFSITLDSRFPQMPEKVTCGEYIIQMELRYQIDINNINVLHIFDLIKCILLQKVCSINTFPKDVGVPLNMKITSMYSYGANVSVWAAGRSAKHRKVLSFHINACRLSQWEPRGFRLCQHADQPGCQGASFKAALLCTAIKKHKLNC